jgi:hypothetical protein
LRSNFENNWVSLWDGKQPTFKTHKLGYLGIVAGISQEIGLIEIIDQQVGLPSA